MVLFAESRGKKLSSALKEPVAWALHFLFEGAKVHTVEQLDVDLSLVPIGATVAFHNPYWKRYIKLASATVAGASSTNTNASPLPSGWTHERFLVVDAGNGLVALHNAIHNGFLKVTSNGLCQGYGASVSDLGPEWLNERFKVVDAGPGRIALWSPMWGHSSEYHGSLFGNADHGGLVTKASIS